MNDQQFNHVKIFLHKCKINIESLDELDKMIIARETLINNDIYNDVKEDISVLKQLFNSSFLTSLQSTATVNQKWPLLNLVRQILKCCNYKMTPKRLSAGYNKEGKKLYKRIFTIEKINQTSNLTDGDLSSTDTSKLDASISEASVSDVSTGCSSTLLFKSSVDSTESGKTSS